MNARLVELSILVSVLIFLSQAHAYEQEYSLNTQKKITAVGECRPGLTRVTAKLSFTQSIENLISTRDEKPSKALVAPPSFNTANQKIERKDEVQTTIVSGTRGKSAIEVCEELANVLKGIAERNRACSGSDEKASPTVR